MNYLKLATKALQEGDPGRAISFIQEFTDKNKSEKARNISEEIILASSRLQTLNQNTNRNLLSYDNIIIEQSKINVSILGIINNLSDEFKDKIKSSENKSFNNLNLPKILVEDAIYYSYLRICSGIGLSFSIAFLVLFYLFLESNSKSLKEILFIGAIGLLGSGLLITAFDGINRTEGLLVNWKILAPHIVIAILMLVGAALIALLSPLV